MAGEFSLRKDVDNLTHEELEAFRGAYARMMEYNDNRGYGHFAGLHGVPENKCWHDSKLVAGRMQNLFLPWHRAYLKYFESGVKDVDPTVSVPWWNYGTSDTVPEAFALETVNGEHNPLYSAPINVPLSDPPLDRNTTRFPGMGVPPQLLPEDGEIAALNGISDFEQFSDAVQGVHNGIHGWTGGFSEDGSSSGDMGTVATAAFDPIFWSHHCMIDRIWYLWQLEHGVNNIPQEYMSQILTPFRYTVRDVLNIADLGYDYAVASVSVPA